MARLKAASTAAVGTRVRELQQERGVSLKRLGDEAGIRESVIGRISRGEEDPSLSEMLALVAVFGLGSMEELVAPLGTRSLLAEATSADVEQTA